MADTKAKIFLANERGHIETSLFRSLNTFCFGNYQLESKTAFGPLYLLNDDSLAGGETITHTVEEDSDLVLIPLVGTVKYRDALENDSLISPGEASLFSLPRYATVEITNPYEQELVNYLQLWIRKPDRFSPVRRDGEFDLEKNKNLLLDVFSEVRKALSPGSSIAKVSIGKFLGRENIIYNLSAVSNGVFVFVIEGAFEVSDRLLESRDGLALWKTSNIEMESLSNNAIILMVEVQLGEPFTVDRDPVQQPSKDLFIP